VTLTFHLLTLKVVSDSYVPILFLFIGLSVLQLGPMYATDIRQTDVGQKHRLMPRVLRSGHINDENGNSNSQQ